MPPFASPCRLALLFAGVCLAMLASRALAGENERVTNAVSFRNDVMAVLSKAGCNTGPCHGNQNGKAGFKLSLRGEDAEFDLAALTRDMFARRVGVPPSIYRRQVRSIMSVPGIRPDALTPGCLSLMAAAFATFEKRSSGGRDTFGGS